jgi:hypothetical protein
MFNGSCCASSAGTINTTAQERPTAPVACLHRQACYVAF